MDSITVRGIAFLATLGLLAGFSPASASFSPWSHFDRTSGLVDNTVQAIVLDGEGRLWVGTRGGVSRFDGEQWLNLTSADGLPDNDINSIFVDPGGQVWMGSPRGFGLYRDGKWSRLGLPGAKEGERVAVVADVEERIWFGYAGGLMRFDGSSGELYRVPEFEGLAVTAIHSARNGGLWVGTWGGVQLFDGTSWKSFTTVNGLSPGAVTALIEDSRGNIWCGTEEGLSEYDGIGWTAYGERDGLPNLHVTSLAEDRQGRIWVGTMGGAGWYDGYEWIWLAREEGIPSEVVLTLCADRNGSIWIGTSHGLTKYDTSWARLPFLGYDEKIPRAPLLQSREGPVFLGADRGFLEKSGRQVEYLGPEERVEGKVNLFFEDGEGTIWVGSDRGLYLYSGGDVRHITPPEYTGKMVRHEYGAYEKLEERVYDLYNGLKDEEVTALWGTGEERMWVGTGKGLSCYEDGRWDLLEENDDLGKGRITALAGNGDMLWVGTPDGLWAHRDEEWEKVPLALGPEGGSVQVLTVDGEGNLWIGTDRGARRWDGENVQSFGAAEGLIGKKVEAIFADQVGIVWFGTEAGVSKFDGAHWSSFSQTDGLHANEITSIVGVGSELWFGSEEGVTLYRPDRAPPDSRVKNAPQGVVGATTFLFEFAGSDFETPPHRMQYSWRLDDGEWSPFAPKSMVTVTDLVNGNHTFAVRSMDLGLNVDWSPAIVVFEVDTGLFDLELVEAEFSEIFASLSQFYAVDEGYRERPVGVARVRNHYDRPLRVELSILIPGLMDFPTRHVVVMDPAVVTDVPLRIELKDDLVLALEKNVTRQILLTMQYSLRGELKESASTHPVTILEKHSMAWDDPERIGLYVTHLDEMVEKFSRSVLQQFRKDEEEAIIYDVLLRGIEIFDTLGAHGVRYIADPDNPYSGITASRPVADLIRFPRETLELKSGDCDDVAVLYAALLQNVGIDTALVDVFDHVFVMFETGLKRRQAGQLAREPVLISSRVQAGGQAREAVLLDDGAGEPSPDAKVLYVDEEERIWVPVEVTILGESFTEAWRKGGKEMRERQFAIIDVNKAWGRYAPLRLPEEAAEVAVPTRREVWRLFEKDLKLQQINLVSRDVSNFLSRLEKDPDDMQALNGLAVLLAKSGFLKQAAARFQRVVDEDPSFAGGHSNLANVFYEQERYEEAIEKYLRALELEPSSPEVHVELALTYCEIGEFIPARAHYELAMKLAPGLKSGEVTRFGESAEEMSSVSGE
jgi:ligand-binding sensor domain-containing protein/tetratricopeptide (TPR) repeat protein